MQNEKNEQQCQRAGCHCKVPAGEQFCSEHCRLAASDKHAGGEEHHSCACGHKACADRS